MTGVQTCALPICGDPGGPALLYDGLRETLGEDTVEVVDVYNEHTTTLPTDGDTA